MTTQQQVITRAAQGLRKSVSTTVVGESTIIGPAAGVTLTKGQAVRVNAGNTTRLTDASAINTANCLGLVKSDTAIGFAPEIERETLQLANWTSLTGSAALTPGARYFADPTTPGSLTSTVPGTGCIVSIGLALTADTLNIEISDPILL